VDRVTIAIGIGSNLGDRQSHLQFARERLTQLLPDVRFASVYETAPVGVPDTQDPFLNTAAVATTTLEPNALLARLQQIETDRGRQRPFPRAARTLDLDLVLYGGVVLEGQNLTVPHPRFRDRLFVLQPLAEVGPMLADPVTGLTMRQLLERLQQASSTRVP
jgi:2-amino-4-hydroxy-6-hydroxymethyldihydropteridine diphosphokinase